jgi:hypothetical protein
MWGAEMGDKRTAVPAEGENHPGVSLESTLTYEEGGEADKCLKTC